MDEPHKHNEQDKPDTKDYILNSLHMKFKVTRQIGCNVLFLTLGDGYTSAGFIKIRPLSYPFVIVIIIAQ